MQEKEKPEMWKEEDRLIMERTQDMTSNSTKEGNPDLAFPTYQQKVIHTGSFFSPRSNRIPMTTLSELNNNWQWRLVRNPTENKRPDKALSSAGPETTLPHRESPDATGKVESHHIKWPSSGSLLVSTGQRISFSRPYQQGQ